MRVCGPGRGYQPCLLVTQPRGARNPGNSVTYGLSIWKPLDVTLSFALSGFITIPPSSSTCWMENPNQPSQKGRLHCPAFLGVLSCGFYQVETSKMSPDHVGVKVDDRFSPWLCLFRSVPGSLGKMLISRRTGFLPRARTQGEGKPARTKPGGLCSRKEPFEEGEPASWVAGQEGSSTGSPDGLNSEAACPSGNLVHQPPGPALHGAPWAVDTSGGG